MPVLFDLALQFRVPRHRMLEGPELTAQGTRRGALAPTVGAQGGEQQRCLLHEVSFFELCEGHSGIIQTPT